MPYLKHYGILGMRWGVRRTPEELGYRTRRNEYPRSRKEISRMSDSELRSKINRLMNEAQYKNLTQRSSIKAGKKIAGIIIGAAALEIAKQFVKGKMQAGLDFITDSKHEELMDLLMVNIKD